LIIALLFYLGVSSVADFAALIGAEGPRLTASAPLEADGLRRFVQAVMEDDPVHWDEQEAGASRFGGLVAPPLYPTHALRRAPGSPDPLDRLGDDPDWDGLGAGDGVGGLPPIPVTFERTLNGGVEAEFFALARVGDVISAQSRYRDIVEKQGSSGPMLIVKVETHYRNQDDQPLARITKTTILR
jgi:MaoC dehydratase-like protein